jgi:hypothetical protein
MKQSPDPLDPSRLIKDKLDCLLAEPALKKMASKIMRSDFKGKLWLTCGATHSRSHDIFHAFWTQGKAYEDAVQSVGI